ncbi:MAG TPA: ABC-type transport auxiliary lipoprotein family protein [Oxalicibacterium sp.]|nr:ABC-type transport auxiliary lipoprotein family protein [Oxalicibacterium sp.]
MHTRPLLAALMLAVGLLLSACAAKPDNSSTYDLGPLRAVSSAASSAAPALPAISVGEVRVPAWLDSPRMFYRLNYANDQQPRAYADSKWAMPPGQLFVQRLKSRLSQAGGVVVPASDGALNLPVLYIEADDFSQVFDRADRSSAHIAIRASLFDGRFLRAQKMFVRDIPADTSDARGGVAALATASDAIIDDIAAWLANLPPKK